MRDPALGSTDDDRMTAATAPQCVSTLGELWVLRPSGGNDEGGERVVRSTVAALRAFGSVATLDGFLEAA